MLSDGNLRLVHIRSSASRFASLWLTLQGEHRDVIYDQPPAAWSLKAFRASRG